jgi:transposase
MAKVVAARKAIPTQHEQLNLRHSATELAALVRQVGVERFAFVCFDPAKHRSRWRMADFLGHPLLTEATVEHTAGPLRAAVASVRHTMQKNDIQVAWVIVERTGQYHLPVQRAFAEAGFETRILHPCATKQYRSAVSPDIKTDDIDLAAQHLAAVAGFGLVELPVDEIYRRLRLLARHRRDLIEKTSTLCSQIREHVHLIMPGYAQCFEDLWLCTAALPMARHTGTPQAVLDLGLARLMRKLHQDGLRVQERTVERVIAWARQAASPPPDAALHQRIWMALDDDRLSKRREIEDLERDLASALVRTPYVLLMAFPGINVVSAAELAGEMGPIAHYGNSNAITGRAGLFPRRYQSDTVDLANGRLARRANRRLRAALMRIADNLVVNNHYFHSQADLQRKQKTDERVIRVRVAKKFTRLAYAVLAGQQVLRHDCCQPGDSILLKLSEFHRLHHSGTQQLLIDLQAVVDQLPKKAYTHEAQSLSERLNAETSRRRGPTRLGELLPAVLARLTTKTTGEPSEVQASR